ncbi:MAG: HNH endonuclease [Candidatus Promineifilaceae bacterium]
MLTYFGAHIVPWSVSHNDDPRNGIALCPLCHWIFDVGLLTISIEYKIKTSPQFRTFGNNLEHLKKVNRQPILLPEDTDFYPDPASLLYHMDNIYRKR